jgi:predicted RNase H-like HicB family nuclease
MEIDRYSVVIDWSEDDQAFIARIPELAGCMADGSTQEEALRTVQEVARIWVETAESHGRIVPEPHGITVAA